MFVASLTFGLLAVTTPQEPASEAQEPLLAEREHKSLSSKLQDYLQKDAEYEFAEGFRNREKANKKRLDAKEKFEKEWEKALKKGNVLASMPDLRAIFYNCFTIPKQKHGTGKLYPREHDFGNYGIFVPKKYSYKQPWTTLLVLPGGKAGTWDRPGDYFAATWEESEAVNDFIVHIPVIPQGLELDPVPDYNRDNAEVEEDRRIRPVLGTFGYVLKNYNVDRGKVFLDCGREACGFGVRLVTLFPDRFAGLILRDPTAVDDIRLGSLRGTAILLMKTAANAQLVDALQKRLEEKNPGKVTVLDAKGNYPHAESAADIAAWTADQKRDMDPSKVVLEPNHDRFNRAYWVDIQAADSLLTTTAEEKPRLEVTADRETNRITVDAVGVEQFELLLNDDLVDLDKEFTIVINGKAIKEKRNRNFALMLRDMKMRFDWDYLFPVKYQTTVPKE